jgi:hypothetical protein
MRTNSGEQAEFWYGMADEDLLLEFLAGAAR